MNFDSVQFNGLSGDIENSVNSVLSVNFPNAENNDMLLFQLDLKGICVSGGSACSSGALKGSAVLNEIGAKGASIRFSFNKENTKEEVNRAIELLKEVTV